MSDPTDIVAKLSVLKGVGVELDLGSAAAEAVIDRVASFLEKHGRTVDSLTVAELRRLAAGSLQ